MMKGGSLPATVVGFKYIVVVSGQSGVQEWDSDDFVNISDRVVSDNPKRRSMVIGDKVVDKVTDYRGTITARCEYLNGTKTYCVEAKHEKPGEYWFEESRLLSLEDQ